MLLLDLKRTTNPGRTNMTEHTSGPNDGLRNLRMGAIPPTGLPPESGEKHLLMDRDGLIPQESDVQDEGRPQDARLGLLENDPTVLVFAGAGSTAEGRAPQMITNGMEEEERTHDLKQVDCRRQASRTTSRSGHRLLAYQTRSRAQTQDRTHTLPTGAARWNSDVE